MLINDTDALARNQRMLALDVADDEAANWIKQELQFSEFTDDPDTSPLNTVKKIGQPMMHTEMERRLQKMIPGLRFEWTSVNITGTQAKRAYIVVPDSQLSPFELFYLPSDQRGKKTVFTFDSGMMPERSMWRSMVKWIPDPTYKPNPYDEDLKEWEVIPRSDDDIAELMDGLGIQYVRTTEGSNPGWSEVKDTNYWWVYYELKRKDEDAGRAGWIRCVVPTGERIRGYRTCVLMCVAAGLISPTQAEQIVGSDNTPEWKQNTGKGPRTRPW